jgi:hypothetical protein
VPQAYLYSFNIGIPGDPQGAEWDQIVEALLAATGAPTAYGMPLKVVSGLVSGIQASGDATPAAMPFGWIVRPYPIQNVALLNDPLGTSTPPTTGKVNVLVRGYITAFLQDATTVALGQAVWIRSAATSGTKVFGGVQSTTDGGNCTLITNNTYFMGPADASGNVVIAVNI